MKKFRYTAKTMETGKIVTHEIEANDFPSAQLKAANECFNRDLTLISVKQIGPDSEPEPTL